MLFQQGKAGNDIELCIQLFNSIKIKQRTSFLYSAMMKAYNKSDMPRETLQLFDQIVNEDDHAHDPIHFILVFNACMLKITYYSFLSFILLTL
jgi:pentatricopeptide repeat protein